MTTRYGRLTAVDDVSVLVGRGTMHGLIGPNGAGKTTLMDVITGRRTLSSGRIVFEGKEITRRSVQWRRRNGMARSFQKTSIFPEFTIRDQFAMVARSGQSDIEEIIETLQLSDIADQLAGTVAYGDQRRVDIGLALLGNSQLLVLDEPAAGLSAEETARLFEHLRLIVNSSGLTALVVEHDVEAVFRTCDLVTVLDLGRVLTTGDVESVRRDERVIRAYLGSGGTG